MPSTARLQQTNRAADSATERPSRTHRDFSRRRKDRRTPSRESARGYGSKESPRRRFLPPACSLADLLPQSSANKEQRPKIYESKKFGRVVAATGRRSAPSLPVTVVRFDSGALGASREDPLARRYVRRRRRRNTFCHYADSLRSSASSCGFGH